MVTNHVAVCVFVSAHRRLAIHSREIHGKFTKQKTILFLDIILNVPLPRLFAVISTSFYKIHFVRGTLQVIKYSAEKNYQHTMVRTLYM